MGKNAGEYPLRGAILERAEGGRSARRATTDPTIRHPFLSGREMRLVLPMPHDAQYEVYDCGPVCVHGA